MKTQETYETEARQEFKDAWREFYRAGQRLMETWDTVDFHADDEFPLPKNLAPPMSFDEWLMELDGVYGE